MLSVTLQRFHPAGAADASGFAAIACDEMVIHTNDAAPRLWAAWLDSASPRRRGHDVARIHIDGDTEQSGLTRSRDVISPGR
jgi:hypothetical protein